MYVSMLIILSRPTEITSLFCPISLLMTSVCELVVGYDGREFSYVMIIMQRAKKIKAGCVSCHFCEFYRNAVTAVRWHPKGLALISVDRAKKAILWTP